MAHPELGNVLKRLHQHERTQPDIINPFSSLEGISWLNKRIIEGSFGPLASLDRSISIELKSQQIISQIKTERSKWQQKIKKDKLQAEREKDKKLYKLKQKWQEIPKNDQSEKEQWIIEALGLASAYFEDFTKEKADQFSFWDNQLLYMTLMTLDKGQYSFGELLSNHRAVQLDTGEGKTKCSGVIATLKILQGKSVTIVEQNYVSAKTHADETAPFFEQFLHEDTGVIIDLSEKDRVIFETKIDPETGLITQFQQSGQQNRQTFLYTNGGTYEQKGKAGRKRAWDKKIVYVDFNSLGIDAVEDRQITTLQGDQVQPPLSERVGLIQEADRLMIDEATNPFEIETIAKGIRGWDIIAESVDFKGLEKRKPKTKKEKEQKQQFLINYFYSLWDNIESINRDQNLINLWKKNNSFYITSDHQVHFHDSFLETIDNNIIESMSPVFNEQEDKNKKMPKEEKYKKTRNFLLNNRHITQIAFETILGIKPQQGFIATNKEPVLMDQYGIPLDRRHLSSLNHVFLQLSNIWEKEGLNELRDIKVEEFKRVIKKTWAKIEIPDQILSRVIPSVLFREFGELRVTSGSLIPVTKTMADIYEAETVVVPRHQPIKNPEQLDSNRLYTLCADKGLAEVKFAQDGAFFPELSIQIKEISSLGQAGLVVLPDISSALEFAEYLKTNEKNYIKMSQQDLDNGVAIMRKLRQLQFDPKKIKIITGKEEFEQRGSLEKIVTSIEAGDIVITTQIAHRDIDPRLSEVTKQNGGLVTFVYDPPNERGLWQALQRSIRADVPGKRVLYITQNSINTTKNLFLVNIPSLPPISSLITSAKQRHVNRVDHVNTLWEKAVSGEKKAQKELLNLYLGTFRYQESVQSDRILFQTARERYVDKFRQTSLNYLENGEGTNILQSYINYLAYRYFKIANKSFPSTNPQAFFNATSEVKRNDLLRYLGVNGQMDFLLLQTQVRKMVLRDFWSDLLYELDYLFRDFNQQSTTLPIHSITEYENFWLTHIENHLKNIDLKKYIRKKFDLTLPE